MLTKSVAKLSQNLSPNGLKNRVVLFPHLITNIMCKCIRVKKCSSSVVRHFPLRLEVPDSIPARDEENFGVRTGFL